MNITIGSDIKYMDFLNSIKECSKTAHHLWNREMFDENTSSKICYLDKFYFYQKLPKMSKEDIRQKLLVHEQEYLTQMHSTEDVSFANGAIFREVNLSGFDFRGHDLRHVEFLYCKLSGCRFSDALNRVTFRECFF